MQNHTPSPPLDPSRVQAESGYRELTLAAVLTGTVIGIVMTAAFVYIALKLGFSLGGSYLGGCRD